MHQKFKCSYKCIHCGRKGHISEGCWQKFPEKAPGYVPGDRENTPAPGKPPKITKQRKRWSKSAGFDRGSDIEASGSEGETSNTRGRRTRRRSNSDKVVPETYPMKGNGLSPSRSSPTWGNSRTENLPPLRLFRIKVLEKESWKRRR